MQDDNVATAKAAWLAMAKLDSAGLFANLSEDIVWEYKAKALGPQSVLRGRDAVRAMTQAGAKIFPDGMAIEITHVHACGETVVLECISRGDAANGRRYDNDYCVIFEFRSGKIVALREYSDTQTMAATLLAP